MAENMSGRSVAKLRQFRPGSACGSVGGHTAAGKMALKNPPWMPVKHREYQAQKRRERA